MPDARLFDEPLPPPPHPPRSCLAEGPSPLLVHADTSFLLVQPLSQRRCLNMGSAKLPRPGLGPEPGRGCTVLSERNNGSEFPFRTRSPRSTSLPPTIPPTQNHSSLRPSSRNHSPTLQRSRWRRPPSYPRFPPGRLPAGHCGVCVCSSSAGPGAPGVRRAKPPCPPP